MKPFKNKKNLALLLCFLVLIILAYLFALTLLSYSVTGTLTTSGDYTDEQSAQCVFRTNRIAGTQHRLLTQPTTINPIMYAMPSIKNY